MVKVTVRSAEYGDGHAILPNLREADKMEMEAATGDVSGQTLEAGIKDCDECWIMEIEDETIAIYGYRASEGKSAYVWLMGTDKINDVSWQFLRSTRNTTNYVADKFDSLWSLADIRNTKHQEWYEWMGFKVLSQLKAGPSGKTFNLIELRREEANV